MRLIDKVILLRYNIAMQAKENSLFVISSSGDPLEKCTVALVLAIAFLIMDIIRVVGNPVERIKIKLLFLNIQFFWTVIS
jgi:hypothetical protein